MAVFTKAAIVALAFLTLPGAAQADTIIADYAGDAYGIVALGKARLEAKLADGRYDATGTMHTVGLASLFGHAVITARAQGGMADGRVTPAHYGLDHFYRNARRVWTIDWTTPTVRVVSEPDIPYSGEVPHTETQRREGRDPVATLLAMGARVTATGRCDGDFRVFDGLYVYDLKMRDKGAGRYRQGTIDLPVLRCALTQKRVAGYTTRQDLEKTLPEAEIWFAIVPDSPIAIFARFTSHLPLGQATIALTRLERR